MQQIPLGLRLPDSARFATFWPGPNAGAVDYLGGLIGTGRDMGAWLWGASSVGKTHLLQAVCAAADQAGLQAGYLPLGLMSAGGAGVFDGWGTHDLIAVDDIDLVAGHADRERALFRLYNELAEHGGRMVVSSTGAPGSLPLDLADLASRLGALVIFHLELLDDAGMLEALQLRARGRGLELPAETAGFLMRRLPRDMASLCRWLDRFDLASLSAQRRLTVPFVRQVLKDAG
jgi:DnaA family protein